MKGIAVTPANYNYIASRLEKFFRHKEFLVWHCFSGGMRKRIPSTFKSPFDKSSKIDTKRVYQNVAFERNGYKGSGGVVMSSTECFMLSYKTVVLFAGNRVIFRHPCALVGESGYCYQCFQIYK